jgi:hypothetical protein
VVLPAAEVVQGPDGKAEEANHQVEEEEKEDRKNEV